MDAPLPFADFLAALRQQGVPVGLREHAALGRLLRRWDGADAGEFGAAVAALLARNQDEVGAIRDLFALHYAAALRPPPEVPAGPIRQGRRRWGLLWVALCLALVLPGLGLGWHYRGVVWAWWSGRHAQVKQADKKKDEKRDEQKPPEPETPRPPTDEKPPVPADPSEPVVTARWRQALVVLPLPVLVFLLIHRVRRREAQQAWARGYWREQLGAMPGPYQYALKLRDLLPPLAREDLEDMATVLGRLYAGRPQGSELDVERTVDRTVQRGALEGLVFRARAHGRAIVLLHDTGPEMRPWQRKAEALVLGLVRRGVQIERWYFDGDAETVSRELDGPRVRLADLARRQGDAPLLVLSTGGGVVEKDGRLLQWVAQLRRFALRTWLHPVEDPGRWRPALRRLPLRVWPMSRAGMLGAAYELAVDEDRRIHVPQQRLVRKRPVQPADVERMKRLVALVPYAGRELAELLRQRYCPAVPEEVMLDLIAAGTDFSGNVLRWPLRELRRLLGALRRDEPLLEQDVRLYLLKVLADSEPPEGSVAHLRWRLERAMQRVYLHVGAHMAQGTAELEELARGVLWEEVDEAVRRLALPGQQARGGGPALAIEEPVAKDVRQRLGRLVQEGAGEQVAAPGRGDGKGQRGGLVWPGLQEVVSAALVAGLLLLGVQGMKVGQRTVPHMKGAYELVWEAAPAGLAYSAGGYLLVKRLHRDAPANVWLRRSGDGKTVKEWRAVVVPEGEPAVVALGAADMRRWYRAHGVMREGNHALSGHAWVKGELGKGSVTVRFYSALDGREVKGVKYRLDRGPSQVPGEAGMAMEVTAGNWTLSAEVPEYGVVTKAIVVLPGANDPLRIDLQANFGLVSVRSLPKGLGPADVAINGVVWGGKPVKVQPGEVTVELTHPCYVYKEKVNVAAGERQEVDIQARPERAALEVKVTPPIATLHIDDTSLKILRRHPAGGAMVYMLASSSNGEIEVGIRAPEYLPIVVKHRLSIGEVQRDTMSLKRQTWDQALTAQIPQQCDKSQGAKYGPVKVGSVVILGRHRPVKEEDNWDPTMDRYVDTRATVSATGSGTDPQGCTTVNVMENRWNWRIRDLKLVSSPPGPAEQPVAKKEAPPPADKPAATTTVLSRSKSDYTVGQWRIHWGKPKGSIEAVFIENSISSIYFSTPFISNGWTKVNTYTGYSDEYVLSTVEISPRHYNVDDIIYKNLVSRVRNVFKEGSGGESPQPLMKEWIKLGNWYLFMFPDALVLKNTDDTPPNPTYVFPANSDGAILTVTPQGARLLSKQELLKLRARR